MDACILVLVAKNHRKPQVIDKDDNVNGKD